MGREGNLQLFSSSMSPTTTNPNHKIGYITKIGSLLLLTTVSSILSIPNYYLTYILEKNTLQYFCRSDFYIRKSRKRSISICPLSESGFWPFISFGELPTRGMKSTWKLKRLSPKFTIIQEAGFWHTFFSISYAMTWYGREVTSPYRKTFPISSLNYFLNSACHGGKCPKYKELTLFQFSFSQWQNGMVYACK